MRLAFHPSSNGQSQAGPRNQLNETRRSSSVRIASASRFCVALGDAARTVVT